MDLKILLIMAVILIGIFKEAKKINKSAQTDDKSPDAPAPLPHSTEPTDMPEAWNPPKPFDHFPKQMPKRKSIKAPLPAESEEQLSVFQRDKDNKSRTQTTIQQDNNHRIPHMSSTPPAAIPMETERDSNEENFAISSAEEARKAIIWGEILQRKY